MTIQAIFPAMGTEVAARAQSESLLQAVERRFEQIEAVASRFRDDSALTRLNHDPRWSVPVEGPLRSLLEAAHSLRSLTGGLVDPAVGNAVEGWGYDRDFDSIAGPDAEPDIEALKSWRISDGLVERHPDTDLDLGGIAKGWTCDLVVDEGLAYYASAGGDLRSSEPDLEVEILDPWERVAARIPVGVGALATSSVARRSWQVGGRRAHHIIDPRTASPATTPILSASVVAETAVEAEAGAKAVVIRGVDGLAWAAAQPWIRTAIAVWADGSVYGLGAAA